MSLRRLPEIKAFQRPDSMSCEPGIVALDRWSAGLRASAAPEDVINILDVIGEDYWTGTGITAKSVGAALQGKGDVTVNVNSPGGDFFEGIAIYNTLRAHAGNVTVNVIGIAASAASMIAMAGDQINIARAGFIMIHNTWVLAAGDRHDLADASAWLAPFDDASAEVYAARSGQKKADVAAWMDNETWFSGQQAVDNGFADGLMAADAVVEDAKAKAQAEPIMALRRVDTMLAHQGLPRSERRKLIQEIKSGKPGAAAPAMQDAGIPAVAASLQQLIASFKQ